MNNSIIVAEKIGELVTDRLDENFKALGMVSALTAISLVGGGVISLIGGVWAWFAWRNKLVQT